MNQTKPKRQGKKQYLLIETPEQLKEFYAENKDAEWLAFDTEFIGEKYFKHKLCLIAVAAEKGNYLIDPLKLRDISLFIKLIENKKITKITHAGENDYRILVKDFLAKPKNIFDTQLSAGFLGYGYPVSLQKLAESELRIKMPKTFSASDWERRPLSPDQIEYALNDVIYLGELADNLRKKLEKMERLEWVIEENKRFEPVKYYQGDLLDKIFNNSFALNLTPKEKMFFIRMYQWREREAERRNCPEKRVLTPDALKAIVQIISSGQTTLENDRRIPNPSIQKHWLTFYEMYKKEISLEEHNLLARITEKPLDNSRRDISTDIIYLIIKYKAIENKIAPELVLSKKEISRMKTDLDYFPRFMNKGWRKDLLGADLVKWLKSTDVLQITHEKHKVVLSMHPPKPKSKSKTKK